MTITLPAVPVTGTTIDTSWGIAVRTALSDLQTQVTALPAGFTLAGADSVERPTQSTTKVDLATITVSIPTTNHIEVRVPWRKIAGFAATVSLGLKLNATEIVAPTAVTSAANSDDSGLATYRLGPRVANYLLAGQWASTGISTTVAQTNITAAMPAATLTSVVVEALVGNAALTIACQHVEVWVLP